MNLLEGLHYELERNKQLLFLYEEIGTAGAFASAFIKNDIAVGEKALASGDIVEMVCAVKKLQENKE